VSQLKKRARVLERANREEEKTNVNEFTEFVKLSQQMQKLKNYTQIMEK